MRADDFAYMEDKRRRVIRLLIPVLGLLIVAIGLLAGMEIGLPFPI